MAEDRAPDRVMPSAAQADKPERFPGRDGEGDRAHMLSDEIHSRESAAFGRRGRSCEGVAHRAPDDHLDEFAGVGVARVDGRKPAAVAKNRDPIGDAQHLVEPVGDIDDANAARAQAAQRLEQALDIGLGKRRGRLIENDNVRFDRERAADRNQRALGRGKRRDRRFGIEVAAHNGERVRGRASDLRPRYEAAEGPRIAGLDRNVLGDRHPFDEPQILVDEGDRQRILSRLRGPSVKHDLARVGLVDSRQHLDQRRLARSVLAEQSVNLAAADVEVDRSSASVPVKRLTSPIILSSGDDPPPAWIGSARSTIDLTAAMGWGVGPGWPAAPPLI